MWGQMLDSAQVVGGSVLTLFLLMGVGFFLGRRGLLSGQTLSQLSFLLLYVVTPAIMIDTFLGQQRNAATVRQLLVAGGVLVGTYLLNMALLQLCFRRALQQERGVLRFAAIYGNTSFMGVPLILAVLGSGGMLATVTCMAVFNISIWSHGAWLMGGRAQISPRKMLLNPGVVGFAAAVLLFALAVPLPGPAVQAVGYVGSLNTPLAMVVIGAQMAAVDLPALVRSRTLYVVCAIKLLAVPVLTMLVLLPFRLDAVTYQAVAILAGCPVAGAAGLMCQLAGQDTALAARLVALSNLLSILTLPVVAVLAGQLAGG